jgi:H+/Cl- antiporter ClcA
VQTLQSIFIVLVILVLCYLVANGLSTRSVWVKGSRRGIVSFREWAHKRSRDDEPRSYWFAIGFYSVALLCLVWLLGKNYTGV